MDENSIESLVGKIDGLDLSTDEIAVLDAVLSAAEEDTQVAGFASEPAKLAVPHLQHHGSTAGRLQRCDHQRPGAIAIMAAARRGI